MKELVKDTLTGGITAVGGITTEQIATIAVSIAAPAISSTMVDFASRALSKWQSSRLKIGCNLIAQKINEYLLLGKTIRTDGDMSAIKGEQAQQVLEGILQNIADEYEKKKLEAHANFFTNLCFDERILFEQALYLTRVIKQLSYRQFILIAISHNSSLKAGGWQFKFKNSQNSVLKNYADLFGEIQSLEQMKIIEDTSQGFALGGSSAPFRLSLLGQTIYEELAFESISEEDKRLVEQMISEVNKA